MYIMLEAFSSQLLAENNWNSDSTQLTIESNGKGGLICYVDDREDDHPLASTNFNSDLGIAAKWVHLNNAAGETGPIVLIFSVPSLPDGKF